MAWETRGRRKYLYRSVRDGGRVTRVYMGKGGGPVAELSLTLWMSDRTDKMTRADAERDRREKAYGDAELLERVGGDDTLRTVIHGLLVGLGYRRHNRGEWRMLRERAKLEKRINDLAAAINKPKALLNYQAPADDSEAVTLFASARLGNADAVAKLPALIRDRKWVGWIGDLGNQATKQLIVKVAKSDPVMKAGLNEKVAELWADLAGPEPTILETLIARRVVNGWLLTHALEIELALTADAKVADRLDRMLTRSQRRMAEAVRELARVRQLQSPSLMARLNVSVALPVSATQAAIA